MNKKILQITLSALWIISACGQASPAPTATPVGPRTLTVMTHDSFAISEEVAAAFENIAVAERQHEKRYLDLAGNIEADRVFKREEEMVWRCRNCGFLHKGKEAPKQCPACVHPQAHFELLGENY